MRIERVDPMVWGEVLGARTQFLLPTSSSVNLEGSGRYRRLPPCITPRNYVNRLSAWNVRGVNGTVKRGEEVEVFREGKLELYALTEIKLKGNGEVSWCGLNRRYGRGR